MFRCKFFACAIIKSKDTRFVNLVDHNWWFTHLWERPTLLIPSSQLSPCSLLLSLASLLAILVF